MSAPLCEASGKISLYWPTTSSSYLTAGHGRRFRCSFRALVQARCGCRYLDRKPAVASNEIQIEQRSKLAFIGDSRMPEERTDLDKSLLPETAAAVVRPGYPRAAGYPSTYGDPYGYDYPAAGGNVNPRQLWRTVKKRKWLIVVIAIVVTTIVTIASFQTKSIYQASTTVEIEKENRTLVRSGDVIIQTDEGADDAYFTAVNMKTKIRVIQSRPLLEDVVATLNLDKNPRFLEVDGKKSVWEAVRSLGAKVKGQSAPLAPAPGSPPPLDRKSTRLNSSHLGIS